MSDAIESVLFYGFPVDAPSESAERSRDKYVHQASFGEDSNVTSYVAIRGAGACVEIGGFHRIDNLPVYPEWSTLLRAFCERHGIAWPDNGPAWHMAPHRY